MKTFSNDIVTPDLLNESITAAFNEQNTFFSQQVEKRLTPIKYLLIGIGIINIATLVAVLV